MIFTIGRNIIEIKFIIWYAKGVMGLTAQTSLFDTQTNRFEITDVR